VSVMELEYECFGPDSDLGQLARLDEVTVIDTNQDSDAYEVVTGRGVLREGIQTDTEV